jgi:hypothetical protein
VRHLDELRARLGAAREAAAGTAGVFNVFPNCSYTETIRVWHPRGPGKTEEWLYLLVDKNAPKEVKEIIRKRQTTSHGPSGGVEQDDMTNWIQCTEAGHGLVGKSYPLNQQLRLGQEHPHGDFPGMSTPNPSELNQRSFYGRWAELMGAASWSEVSLSPRRS